MDQFKLTFDELVELHTRNIHTALLEGGSKGMKTAIFIAMSWAAEWCFAKNTKQPPQSDKRGIKWKQK